MLQSTDVLSDDQWDRVFQQIEDNDDNDRPNHPLFRAISLSHIKQLAEEAPELLAALGEDYAEYAQGRSFDFDYCDVIASKAQLLYQFGELDLKSRIVVAMLSLGTSRNRWFVERKFMQMAGPDIDESLAERIKVEIEVQGIDFACHIEHVERSIGATREDLHPTLQALLDS
jgi:hypothetical protein